MELNVHDLIVDSEIIVSFIIEVRWINQIPLIHIDLLNQHLMNANLPFFQIVVPDVIIMISQNQCIIAHHLIHHKLFEVILISNQILDIIIGMLYD